VCFSPRRGEREALGEARGRKADRFRDHGPRGIGSGRELSSVLTRATVWAKTSLRSRQSRTHSHGIQEGNGRRRAAKGPRKPTEQRHTPSERVTNRVPGKGGCEMGEAGAAGRLLGCMSWVRSVRRGMAGAQIAGVVADPNDGSGGRLSRNRLTDPRQYGVRARGGKGQSSQRKARLCGAYGHKVGVRG